MAHETERSVMLHISLSMEHRHRYKREEIFDMAIAGLEPRTSPSKGEVPNHKTTAPPHLNFINANSLLI